MNAVNPTVSEELAVSEQLHKDLRVIKDGLLKSGMNPDHAEAMGEALYFAAASDAFDSYSPWGARMIKDFIKAAAKEV